MRALVTSHRDRSGPDHIEDSWQDNPLANLWRKAARAIESCSEDKRVKALP